MKKVFERLAFMVIGAVLVSAAYLVGSADKTVDAKFTTFEDVVIEGTLIVKGAVAVGDPRADHRNLVHIKADEKSSSIFLFHNRGKTDSETSSDAIVILSASQVDKNPIAGITLKNKLGNTALATCDLGWSKPNN